MKKNKKRKIVIVSHVFTYGKSQAFYDYLEKIGEDVFFIGHPLTNNPFRWIVDVVDTFWQVLKKKKVFNLYFGSNNLNAFVGIVLKKMGRVRKVIFYTPDSPMQRFKNKPLNNFYHWLDKICVKKADMVWNNSKDMVLQREKKGLAKKYRKKQIEVPMGTYPKKPKKIKKNDKPTIVFVGHLLKHQGAQLIIKAFPKMKKLIPNLKLIIIGDGPMKKKLKRQAEKLNLGNVKFLGLIKDNKNVNKILRECSLAVAPYKKNSPVRYTDSGKIKLYLGAGLPVITTSTPLISKEIKKNNCGAIINYNASELSRAVCKIVGNKNKLNKYRGNAYLLAKKYSYSRLFKKALDKLDEKQ